MTKMLLFLFAAGTVFAAPKFKIVGQYAAVVGCTKENADRYALKTVVIEDQGIEKSMPVKYCLEQNKRGQTYHSIAAECSYRGCTWNGEETWTDYDKKGVKYIPNAAWDGRTGPNITSLGIQPIFGSPMALSIG